MTAATPSPAPAPAWRGALAGLLAAASALAAGELVAGFAGAFTSPVVAVGTLVIDVVPGPVERFAIEVFGTYDKLVLIIGTLLVVAGLGAGLGVLARRRPVPAAAGIAAFGLIGLLASLRGPDAGAAAAVPSVVAIVVGVVALLLLVRAAARTAPAPEPAPGSGPPAMRAGAGDRRSFLALSGGVAVAVAAMAVAGRALQGRATAVASRAGITLPRPRTALPPLPAAVDLGVEGVPPFVTPNADFYRIDTALVVPQVRAEDWSLSITGMVDRPFSLGYDELLARPLSEFDVTLTCVSNPIGGDLVGNARWTGIRLRDLLDEAGVQGQADQVVGRSVDGWTCGFPVPAVYDRDAIVAVGMNGEPLPIERGFPARLVTPGLYGYVSATKWLTEIELTRFDAFDQYWVRRGWAARGPIKAMARIDVPASFDRVPAGAVDVAGVAWAQTLGIERVEVRIDDGDWQQAELGAVPNDNTWRQWRFRWDAPPGRHTITARAVDGTGKVQTEDRAEPFPDGASGWMRLVVMVDDGGATG